MNLTKKKQQSWEKHWSVLSAHPATDDDTRDCAIDLAHHLLALAAGHFDDWGDAEQEFVQQGVEAREQATSRAATTPRAPAPPIV